jgi:spermidine/putrescine-binding protein
VGDERASQQLKYRNKEVKGGKQFYEDVNVIVDEFADNSADMLHGWSTDMAEGMKSSSPSFYQRTEHTDWQLRIGLGFTWQSASTALDIRKLTRD